MPRKTLVGTVVSDKMDKTIVVSVTRTHIHPFYGKTMKTTKKYHADDPEGLAGMGDTVEIEECKPLSKMKKFKLVKVLKKDVYTGEIPETPEAVEDSGGDEK
ncbi:MULTISPECIES: 30S ribosomal protein S17 [Mesotoga]|jgi:small subunit ribosomal protein S17|uniref:Small ribosomal subunit protein uS17 n=1 Tax=Mesotoga prima MesG1.Ag.4.2 TaxID=660470 RepID=I2F3A0_9BACT|nr:MULTISPECIES: 30S ribosomal protein S17 [Mesotoga]CCU85945.1 30S ribosomal protein S17 [Mesotoga infera]AFK06403.1 30S ribosomal protein S17 [Mesotoga prima MesG1.Ag.4.2]MDK2943502.1 small subunit ribosomal protein [Mesotoga sp.]RLL87760.1 30S ribosomal protein S17 [Mesotoga sp. H07pep.5.4]RLL91492.1 30S ribosomal protein S17 [Mesotoga sp. HF07.pep.5.2.highcov]